MSSSFSEGPPSGRTQIYSKRCNYFHQAAWLSVLCKNSGNTHGAPLEVDANKSTTSVWSSASCLTPFGPLASVGNFICLRSRWKRLRYHSIFLGFKMTQRGQEGERNWLRTAFNLNEHRACWWAVHQHQRHSRVQLVVSAVQTSTGGKSINIVYLSKYGYFISTSTNSIPLVKSK